MGYKGHSIIIIEIAQFTVSNQKLLFENVKMMPNFRNSFNNKKN